MNQYNSILREFGKPFSVISDSPMPDLEEAAPVKLKKIKGENDMVVCHSQQLATVESKWEWLKGFASGLLILEKEAPSTPKYSGDSTPDYSSSSSSPASQESISNPSIEFSRATTFIDLT